jgi:hypothetical protein
VCTGVGGWMGKLIGCDIAWLGDLGVWKLGRKGKGKRREEDEWSHWCVCDVDAFVSWAKEEIDRSEDFWEIN